MQNSKLFILPLSCDFNTIPNATGSCYMELAGTKIVASITGPITSSAKNIERKFSDSAVLLCDVRYAPYLCSIDSDVRRGEQNDKEKEISKILTIALTACVKLDLYPKSEIRVNILVLEDTGHVFSTCISCVSLSFVHAGIECYDIVTCVSVSMKEGEIVMDSSEEDSLTLCYMPNLKQITYIQQESTVGFEELQELMSICIGACDQRYELMRSFLL